VSTDRPDVAAIIATHHRPELLRVALDAVVNQTYPGMIECIVVFDRAEPDTSLVMDEPNRRIPNRRITVTTNLRAPGLAGARNSGIAIATAPYVAFCDDDDEWLPTKIERQVEAIESSVALTSVTGIIVQYADHSTERVPRQQTFTLQQLVRNRMMEAHPSTVLVRRDALNGAIGLVDEEIPGSYGEDFDWMIRALQAGAVAVVEEPLVNVRWGQSLFSQRWQTIIDSIDYGLAKHLVFHQDKHALARLYGRRAFANAALGNRRAALRGAWRTIRTRPSERRAYLAIAVGLHLVSAERLMKVAHERGHGI
jgi:glycosyltransferase involved in cell wall biosynthesis